MKRAAQCIQANRDGWQALAAQGKGFDIVCGVMRDALQRLQAPDHFAAAS
jgi:hypothetical protein